MTKYFLGNVFWAYYPYDDEVDSGKPRPVIVFDEVKGEALVIKVTKHSARDENDIDIIHWKKAGLSEPSVARMSKIIVIPEADMYGFIGNLDVEDQINVLEIFYKLNE